ncbi:MAG: hypothetical protein QOH28_1554, partial [Actinomycetota bacterium]|nr:hypothetical protein [Actinomycetota bacterium]
RTTTRSRSPALRGGTPGLAEVGVGAGVGADVDVGAAAGLLLLEQPVIAASAAISAAHASRFR